MEKKEKLLLKMEEIKQQLNAIEEKQVRKITKLAIKHGLGGFDEKQLDNEFMLMAKKLNETVSPDTKKND